MQEPAFYTGSSAILTAIHHWSISEITAGWTQSHHQFP